MSITLNITQTTNVIKKLISVKEKLNIPIFLWGHRGIGKTTIVRSLANELDYNCVTLNFANIPIEDATGFPDGKGGYHKPEWLTLHKDNNKPTIYFCDEINRAPKYVLQGLFNFILEGRIHTHTINPKDVVIVAGNPDCDEYETTIFEDAAFLSRFAHIYMVPDVNEYIKYLNSNKDIHPSIVDSVKLYHEKLDNNIPPERRIKTTPDNRALEKIGRLMKLLTNEEFTDVGYYITAAMVGIDFATLLIENYKKYNIIPPIEEIIKTNPINYTFTNNDLDKLIIINRNLFNWLCAQSFDETNDTFNIDKSTAEGVRNYINFIPRDYQYSLIMEFKNNIKIVKRAIGVGNIVAGTMDEGLDWLKELIEAKSIDK